jgi:hypothetical protein
VVVGRAFMYGSFGGVESAWSVLMTYDIRYEASNVLMSEGLTMIPLLNLNLFRPMCRVMIAVLVVLDSCICTINVRI